LVLLFVGLASANFYESVLDNAVDDVVRDFMTGMEGAPALADAVDVDDETANTVDDDVKTALGKTLKEVLDKTVQKIKDSIEHGKKVTDKLVDTFKDVVEKLKTLGLDAHEDGKSKLDSIKDKIKSGWGKLLEKLGLKNDEEEKEKRSVIKGIVDSLNLTQVLQDLKAHLLEKLNFDQIKEYVQKLFGNASALGKNFIDTMKAKGLDALRNMVDRLLNVFGNRQTRALTDIVESLKDFFGNLKEQISERFGQFAKWLATVWDEGKEHAKTKIEQLKDVAKQVIDHAKETSDEVKREAIEYLRPYREQLGDLWTNLLDTVHKHIKGE